MARGRGLGWDWRGYVGVGRAVARVMTRRRLRVRRFRGFSLGVMGSGGCPRVQMMDKVWALISPLQAKQSISLPHRLGVLDA